MNVLTRGYRDTKFCHDRSNDRRTSHRILKGGKDAGAITRRNALAERFRDEANPEHGLLGHVQ